MEVTQIYELVNSIAEEVLGTTGLIQEDLSNIVDLGTALFNAHAYDKYVKSMVNKIGKTVFVTRPYEGSVPKVFMDAWEFGSVLEKVQADIPEAQENETWELENGASYDPNIFYKPSVSVKFFNSKTTFEVPLSITDRQIKMSLTSVQQLNSFMSMIYDAVDKAMTIRLDGLIMSTINNAIASTAKSEYKTADFGSKSTVKAVNLLYLYNQLLGSGNEITADEALTNTGFLKFSGMIIRRYIKRLQKITTLFNIGGKPRFTPKKDLVTVMHTDFVSATGTYLEADTFNKELVALPNYDEVPYWQGTGDDYEFDNTGTVKVKTASNDEVEINGVIGVIFDKNALGVTCPDKRVTSNYNGKAEFTNNWFKWDASYFNDQDENFVLFFIQDEAN